MKNNNKILLPGLRKGRLLEAPEKQNLMFSGPWEPRCWSLKLNRKTPKLLLARPW